MFFEEIIQKLHEEGVMVDTQRMQELHEGKSSLHRFLISSRTHPDVRITAIRMYITGTSPQEILVDLDLDIDD